MGDHEKLLSAQLVLHHSPSRPATTWSKRIAYHSSNNNFRASTFRWKQADATQAGGVSIRRITNERYAPQPWKKRKIKALHTSVLFGPPTNNLFLKMIVIPHETTNQHCIDWHCHPKSNEFLHHYRQFGSHGGWSGQIHVFLLSYPSLTFEKWKQRRMHKLRWVMTNCGAGSQLWLQLHWKHSLLQGRIPIEWTGLPFFANSLYGSDLCKQIWKSSVRQIWTLQSKMQFQIYVSKRPQKFGCKLPHPLRPNKLGSPPRNRWISKEAHVAHSICLIRRRAMHCSGRVQQDTATGHCSQDAILRGWNERNIYV